MTMIASHTRVGTLIKVLGLPSALLCLVSVCVLLPYGCKKTPVLPEAEPEAGPIKAEVPVPPPATPPSAKKEGDENVKIPAPSDQSAHLRAEEALASAGLAQAFVIPSEGKDQHGNLVHIRNGYRHDPETRLPYEIWMKDPRIEFILVLPGTFRMGSPEDELGRFETEGPVHEVQITSAFYFAKYEITQRQWEQAMGSNPSRFAGAGKNAPVENVNWDEAVAFARALGLALPTEAQWEFACRAGTRTSVFSGTLTVRGKYWSEQLDDICWYGGNSEVAFDGAADATKLKGKPRDFARAGTHPVGLKKPNPWGFYDSFGNVHEWCEDWLDGDFYKKPASSNPDPRNDEMVQISRVVRGGSWRSEAIACRSAARGGMEIMGKAPVVGLRPVKAVPR